MTQIERRQTRIQRIRVRNDPEAVETDIPAVPTLHHNIGKSQNHPQSITMFLQGNAQDPAIKAGSFP
jgi:hypothetical protein